MGLYGPYETYDECLMYADFDVYDYPEPDQVKEYVFVDDEGDLEEIQEHFGCKMEDLDEGQLFEIVEKMVDVPGDLRSAEWDPAFDSIDYVYDYVG